MHNKRSKLSCFAMGLMNCFDVQLHLAYIHRVSKEYDLVYVTTLLKNPTQPWTCTIMYQPRIAGNKSRSTCTNWLCHVT